MLQQNTSALSFTLTYKGQMQSNLRPSPDKPPTQTDQCCRIFGDSHYFLLKAPISGAVYEMTGSVYVHLSPLAPHPPSVSHHPPSGGSSLTPPQCIFCRQQSLAESSISEAQHVNSIELAWHVRGSKDLLIDFCLDSMSNSIH